MSSQKQVIENEKLFELDKFEKSFGRHQSFHPRYGWLTRGFLSVCRDPYFFHDDSAGVKIGVGKNMVSSIKYWLLAFKLIKENKDEEGKAYFLPTDFGQHYLSESGHDPYLQDLRSLWVLHWKLLEPVSKAPTWFAILNHYNSNDLSTNKVIV